MRRDMAVRLVVAGLAGLLLGAWLLGDGAARQRQAAVAWVATPPPPPPSGDPYPAPGAVGADGRARTVLTPPGGVLEITEEHAVLRDVVVRGGIDFGGAELVLRNVVVEGGHGWWGLVVTRRPDAVLDVADSTIRAVAELPDADVLQPLAGGRVLARRVDLSGGVDGVKATSGSRIEDCWIHDLSAAATAHNDGVQVIGSDVVVARNRIEVNPPAALDPARHNAAVFLQPPTAQQPLEGVVVADNFLMGGGYTLRVEGPADAVTVTGNVFGPRGTTVAWAGDVAIAATVARVDWRDNRRGDELGRPTGLAVPRG